MPVTIYHNPRCSKSRETLQLLRNHGIEPLIVDYLKAPPSVSELDALCKKLGLEPKSIVRYKEPIARELGMRPDQDRSRAEWLALIEANPVLLERPIVVNGQRARLGRPPENVMELFPTKR
jgi:arsenate reductase